uniref:Ketosynthase family 3 (KS3) domain-containing protein n=1 Tax=Parascaris equorum TaxID=6256 RepID=A0A914S467_PAREQ
MALVGAANIILNPQSTCVLERAQMLSPKGICKVFDVDADGYIRSEGVGMVLIKKVNPQEHFRGVKIVAYAMGHNGRSAGLTVPNGRSQLELISAAIRQTNLGEISFVEAHATGTPIGDPIEVRAIREAFEKANLNPEVRLCSSKSQLGHCEAAAGVASFLTTLMSLENGYAVPNSHFMLRNDALMQNNTAMITSVFSVGEELNAKRTALMNCFGFSGSN